MIACARACPLSFAALLFLAAAAMADVPAPPEPPAPVAAPAPPEPAPAPAEPSVSPAELARLIEQLGSDAYRERVAAEERLGEIGLVAKGELIGGLKHDDAHVRRSCRRILASVMEQDYAQRLSRFKKGGDSVDADLPGWTHYQQIVGADDASRQLFVKMHEHESGLMASFDAGRETLGQAVQLRFKQIFQGLYNRNPGKRKQPDAASVAALLFALSRPDLKLDDSPQQTQYWTQLVHSSNFRTMLTNGPNQSPAKKLLGFWLKQPSPPQMITQKLSLAIQYQLPEGAQLAKDALRDKKANLAGSYRAYAVQALASLAKKDEAIEILAELIDDETQCTLRFVNGKRFPIQVRDVALGWLVHLTDQQHKAYFMPQAEAAFQRAKSNPRYTVSYSYMYYQQPEDREKALAKWKDWIKDHPLKKSSSDDAEVEESTAEEADEAPPQNQVQAMAQQVAGPVQRIQVFPAGKVIVRRAVPGGQLEETEELDPFGKELQRADRQDVNRLEAAREYIREGRFAEATQILGEILLAEEDYYYQPDRDVPLYQMFKTEADRLLGAMPKAGLQAYELQYGRRAEQRLDQAIENADFGLLVRVGRDLFHTQAGNEATYLIGLQARQSGEPFRAALYLERVRKQGRHAAEFEPDLSLQLAACWAKTGLPQAARAQLAVLKREMRGRDVLIGGQRIAWYTDERDALNWLETRIGPTPSAEAVGWPMYRGGAERNRVSAEGTPYLKPEVIHQVQEPLILRNAKQIREKLAANRTPALPTFHPIVVEGRVVYRTPLGIETADLATGELQWASHYDDTLWSLVTNAEGGQQEADADFIEEGLERRLWKDPAFGLICSDGRRVFGVEGLAFSSEPTYQRVIVGPDGKRHLDLGGLNKFNVLSAYDLKTGKLVWELGGPPSARPDGSGALPLAGTMFLGPPLPMAGRLYAVGRTEKTVDGQPDSTERTANLMELDPATGKLLRMTKLPEPAAVVDSAQRVFNPYMQAVEPTAPLASSPSAGEGVIVCPLSESRFVGIDLTSWNVLWVYDTPNDVLQPTANINRLFQAQLLQQQERGEMWADSSVTIVGERLLLTPEVSQSLYCLDLHSGRLLWKQPRRDGLYVAGARDGRVLVVGRGAVWCYDLETGAAAWPEEKLALPAGAAPSGRGYFGDNRYFLPLSTGEVAAIDATNGALAARSRAPTGKFRPGNLVAIDGVILSQNALGLWRTPTLSQRDEETQVALAADPQDPQKLLERGEVLLYRGQLMEAVEHLRASVARQPTPRAKELLLAAVTEGLRSDVAAFRPLAADLDDLIRDQQRQDDLLRELALALHDAGEHRAAFDAYLRLIDLAPQSKELEQVSALRDARREAWLGGALGALRSAGDEALQAAMDAEAALRAESMRPDVYRIVFGEFPAATPFRLQLARVRIKENKLLEAELLLRNLIAANADPELALEARGELLSLYVKQKRPVEALAQLAELEGRLAAAKAPSGSTGAALADSALAAEHPFRKLGDPAAVWPQNVKDVKAENKRSNVYSNYRYPVRLIDEDGAAPIQVKLTFDIRNRNLIAEDSLGRQMWSTAVQPPATKWGFNNNMYSYAMGVRRGQMFFVWLGLHVVAVDAREGKVLWNKPVVTTDPPYPGMVRGVPLMGMRLRTIDGVPDGEPLPLAANRFGVFFQQDRRLIAVDPLTGEPRWRYDGVSDNSDIVASDDAVFVTNTDSGETLVLEAASGRERGRRKLPRVEERILADGERMLYWTTEGEQRVLALRDTWAGQDIWSEKFASGSQLWATREEVLVGEPSGQLTVLGVTDGKPRLVTNIGPQEDLQGVVLLPSQTRYVVFVNRPTDAGNQGPNANVLIRGNFPGAITVEGDMLGFDRSTGKLVWERVIPPQMLRFDLPRESPVIALLVSFRKLEANRRYTNSENLLCIDRRSGETIHDSTSSTIGYYCEVTCDPDKKTVKVQTRSNEVNIEFGE